MSEPQPTPDFSLLAALIEARRGRVARLVNRELIDLYWELGGHISQRIATDGWGRGTVGLLSSYLSSRMPSARGFSASNLWRMRQFFEIWNPPTEKLATALREVSWSCHLDLMGRCKSAGEREFYLILAIRENHSVRELRRAIDTATFERSSLADSKLATLSRVSPVDPQSHFRDSYIIEFLDLPPGHSEADLRRALVRRLADFLRELGRNFTFVGEEFPIQVGTRDGSIDLLLFHRGLNCLVAIELKTTAFEPARPRRRIPTSAPRQETAPDHAPRVLRTGIARRRLNRHLPLYLELDYFSSSHGRPSHPRNQRRKNILPSPAEEESVAYSQT